MKRLFALTAMVFFAANFAFAHTSMVVEKTCPLCQTTFKTEIDMSGTQVGMRLDLKPLGFIAAPWRIPVCPKCHFVLYDDEISKEELKKCIEIVASEDFKKHVQRASYYLLGILYEKLGKDHLRIAHVFLKASWQEERETEHLKDDLQKSLEHFNRYLALAKEHGQSWETSQILTGEILRRLGEFDKAKDHLQKIAQMKEFQGNFLADVIQYELELCVKKDSQPHNISEVKTSRASEQKNPPDKP